MTNKKALLLFLLPVLVSFILHFHVFNLDVLGYHVWRQSQTQTVIYNFHFSDHFILHPQKFDISNGTTDLMYEFPLYQWIISKVNYVLGYSVLHTRIVTFIFFIFILFAFYRLIRNFVSTEIALISNTLLCFSPLLYYYCVNPMPDTFALCLGIWALVFFFAFNRSQKFIHFILFSFFLMLAALVKLPFILFGSVYLYDVFQKLKIKSYSKLPVQLILILLCFIPIVAWYSIAIPTWKNNLIASGIFNNEKGILEMLDFFQFNLFSTIPELVTNYASCVFLVIGLYTFFKHFKSQVKSRSYLVVLFFSLSLYFIYELNMIEKVHDYYLLPFVPLIFFVVAYGVKIVYQRQKKWLIYLVLCVVPITAWIRVDGRWNTVDPGFNADYLYKGDNIQKLIPKGALCLIDYDNSKFISLYYLKRHGYSLQKNELNLQKLNDLYVKGVRYLVTENPEFDPKLYPQFQLSELFRGSIKVFKIERI